MKPETFAVSQQSSALLARGRTAEIYAWGNGRVLKLFFDWCPESWARQEARVTRAVQAAGLPVPGVEDMIEVDGRTGIVFERVEGRSMLEEFRARPWRIFRIAVTLAELHAAMHKCEVPGLPPFSAVLEKRVRGLDGLPDATKETVLVLLARLPEGNAVCHGDFHPDNVLLTERGPIILDWMTATEGNPLGDVARTSLILQMAGPPPGQRGGLLLRLGARLANRIYLRRYFALAPHSREQLARWLIPVAAGRLEEKIPGEREKLLAIIQAGVAKLRR
jgi:aminoglycoside phosphotransferase (APT) family kinase protein